MKRILKSSVALFLAVLMTFSAFALTVSAVAYENDLPVVYLRGATEKVYDKSGKQVWPVDTDIADILLDSAGELTTALASSLISSDWSVYGAALEKALTKYFNAGALDNNGNPKNGTDIKHSATPKKKTENFGLGDYVFKYDPRLDPWETAEDLAEYIDAVLAATGKKKVQLVARCMGSCFASA